MSHEHSERWTQDAQGGGGSSALGIAHTGLDGTFLWMNARYAAILGRTPTEMVGKKFAEFTHPPDLEHDMAAMLDLIAGSLKHYTVEKRYLHKDGHIVPISLSVSLIRDEKGRPECFAAFVQDITHGYPRRAGGEMEKHFKAIVENSDDAIISKTLDGIITSWNPAAEKMFGYTAEEITGRPITLIIPPERAHEEQQILERLRSGGHIHHFETVRVRKDGSLVDVSVTISPVKDDSGAITGASKIIRDITESRRNVNELALLRTCVEELNDIVLVTEAEPIDEPGPRIIFVNDAFERLTGYTRAETIGRSPRFLQGEKTDRAALQRIRDALREKKPAREQVVNYGKDGTEYLLDLDIMPVCDREGRCTHFAAIERDITHEKSAEEALRESDERLRTVTQMAQVGLVMVDEEHRYQYANRAYADIFQLPSEEIVGMGVVEVLPAVYESQIRPRLERAFRGEPVEYELTIPATKDRREHRYAVTYQPGKYRGRPVVVVVIVDVTARKQAEERVAEQAALLDKTQDAILVRDMADHVLFWSKGAERLYGWTAEEAMGAKITDLVYDNGAKFTEASISLGDKGEWSGELKQCTKAKRPLVVEARWTLLRDAQGRPKSILAINTDVTERKAIEAQFMRAQRMESIGVLAGGVAHDLNNILSPIMMAIEILRDAADPVQKNHILDTIESSAARGAEIVRQILSFARGLEGRRVEIQPKHLLKDIEHIIHDTFPKDIFLESNIPTGAWTILGDPTQLHQIMLNLCVNARDAMAAGGTLSVSVENRVIDEQYASMNLSAKPGDYSCISVTDTGTGMSQEVIDKIFDPFFTTKEVGKGTGLGLSTVLALVKSHGGFLNVYSEPGKGTTFRIYLPAITAGHTPENMIPEAALPRGHGETVLVVDDEISILTITSQTLEAFGYRVVTADNGAAAVAEYARQTGQISLVLTDMMMPVMDGAATIHALRKIDPSVKIIAASGLNANENVARAANAGIPHFLAKPYTAGALLKMVRAVLDGVAAPLS